MSHVTSAVCDVGAVETKRDALVMAAGEEINGVWGMLRPRQTSVIDMFGASWNLVVGEKIAAFLPSFH